MNRQGFQPAKDGMFLPFELFSCQAEMGKPAQNRFKNNFCFQAYQRRANAKMDTDPKAQMPPFIAFDFETVGV